MKAIFLLTFLIISLSARDNPFKEIISEKDIDMSEAPNLPKPKYFTTEEINLPSSARVVEEIIVKYKNVDGTIANKRVRVNKDIDWHHPLIVNHAKVKKDKTKVQKSEDSSKKLGNKILSTIPPPITDNIALATEEIASLKPFYFLEINVFKNRVMLKTKDLKIRNFVTTNPDKIIIDLDRDIPNSKKFDIANDSFFKEIAIGRHDKYYRVAMKLDGKYRHSITKVDSGYLIEVK